MVVLMLVLIVQVGTRLYRAYNNHPPTFSDIQVVGLYSRHSKSNPIELNPQIEFDLFGNRTKSNSHKKNCTIELKQTFNFFCCFQWHCFVTKQAVRPQQFMSFVSSKFIHRAQLNASHWIVFGCRTQSNTIKWIEFDWVQFV